MTDTFQWHPPSSAHDITDRKVVVCGDQPTGRVTTRLITPHTPHIEPAKLHISMLGFLGVPPLKWLNSVLVSNSNAPDETEFGTINGWNGKLSFDNYSFLGTSSKNNSGTTIGTDSGTGIGTGTSLDLRLFGFRSR